MAKKIAFFDIESLYSFTEIDPYFFNYSFKEKAEVCKTLFPQLGLAVACAIVDGEKQESLSFEEDNVKGLAELLYSADAIVGHNILNFDYAVLSKYCKQDLIDKFVSKTIDTSKILHDKTGKFVKLNSLAKYNGIEGKTMEGKDAPKFWREGKKELVRDYCFNDVKMLREVYYLGKEDKLKLVDDVGKVTILKGLW